MGIDVKAVRALQTAGPRPYLAAYAANVALIAGAYVVAGAANRWFVYWAVALFLGTRQHALGVLAHDGAHGLMSRNRTLNRVMTEFGAWPLVINVFDGYREWHMEHHRKLGTPEDPELSSYRRFFTYRTPVGFGRVVLLFLGDLVGCGAVDVLVFAYICRPRKRINQVKLASFWVGVFALAAVLHAVWVPLLWLASLFTSFWAVFRIRTWAEHVGETAGPWLEASHRYHVGWLGRALFFPHNVWLHYEHHVHAAVPFYNLRKLRALDDTRPVISFGEVFQRLRAPSAGAAAKASPLVPTLDQVL